MSDPSGRILVIPSWYPPDGGQFFQDQAEALAGQGYDVDVLVKRLVGVRTLRLSQRDTLTRFSLEEVNGTRVIRSWLFKWPGMEMRNMRRWARSVKQMYREYERRFGRPSLVLAHSALWAGYAASIIAEESGLPLLVVEHRSRFTMGDKEASSWLPPAYAPFLEKAYATARKVVTVSDALQPRLKTYLKDIDKLLTIPNMVDTGFFTPAAPGSESGTPGNGSGTPGNGSGDPLRILTVGRLEHEKGMDLLLRAFARMAGEREGCSLRIVGSGPLEEHLQSLCMDLGVEDKVYFLGKLEPSVLLEEFRGASFFALASRFEAFGVVFIEAMACGLPVVATMAGGPETFVPEMAGQVVEKDDVDALHAGLHHVGSHLTDYDPTRIRKYAVDQFSQEAVAARYDKLIKSLLDG